jgi:hypothetical protein
MYIDTPEYIFGKRCALICIYAGKENGGEKAQKKGKKREEERTKRKERRKIPCLDSFGRDLEVEIVKKSL